MTVPSRVSVVHGLIFFHYGGCDGCSLLVVQESADSCSAASGVRLRQGERVRAHSRRGGGGNTRGHQQ